MNKASLIHKTSTAVEREARGDWRNFKGDYYHLLYAIWLLLHEEGVHVAFYRGNDLLASPPAPRVQTKVLLSALDPSSNRDIWIQLKSTSSRWNCTSLMKDVLFNFVYNALSSSLNEHTWEARLVTQAAVAQDELKMLVEVLASTKSKESPNLRLFDKEVNRAFTEWTRDQASHSSFQVEQWTL